LRKTPITHDRFTPKTHRTETNKNLRDPAIHQTVQPVTPHERNNEFLSFKVKNYFKGQKTLSRNFTQFNVSQYQEREKGESGRNHNQNLSGDRFGV
jgi:hypothetical protein